MEATRDVSPEAGFHFRLDLDDGTAIELDVARLYPTRPEVFVEVFGRRGSDGQVDSVASATPIEVLPVLSRALSDAYYFAVSRRNAARRNGGQA